MPKKVTIHAGDYCFGHAGIEIHTLLGSCVSITLWHPQKRIGGMCHFALPQKPKSEPTGINPRYAEDCLLLFERSCLRKGTRLSEYEAKVFGGSDSTPRFPHDYYFSRTPIGEKNSAAAFELLLARRARIVSADVGENGYRRVIFDIASGDVWVKFKSFRKTQQNIRVLSGRR